MYKDTDRQRSPNREREAQKIPPSRRSQWGRRKELIQSFLLMVLCAILALAVYVLLHLPERESAPQGYEPPTHEETALKEPAREQPDPEIPTAAPTPVPTTAPTKTAKPSAAPTEAPTQTPKSTTAPIKSAVGSAAPTAAPTEAVAESAQRALDVGELASGFAQEPAGRFSPFAESTAELSPEDELEWGERVMSEVSPEPEAPAPEETLFVHMPTPSPRPSSAPMERPTPEPALRSARVRAVGDLMVHQRQLEIAQQEDGSYDFHPQYELIASSLQDADYTIANLETTIGKYDNMPYSGYPRFNSPESLLETVSDAGVDFLTLANNHILDRYFSGMVATVDHVEAHGMAHGGANRTPEERDRPIVVEVNGIAIGMLCYTQMTNGMEVYCDEAAIEYGVNYLGRANFAADVAALREAGAEVVIALPHWGEEYHRRPESNTVAIARRLVAAGVDVVLGSHPHMVQPVGFLQAETADGEKRTGLVAFSLGNFISNMRVEYTDSGIILEFTLRETQDGSFAIEDVGCVPVYCWRQEDMIRAVSALKYYENPPQDMTRERYASMQKSYRDLKALLGEEIAMLAE